MNKTHYDQCMILAAGRGERMRPLTDDCPKPLLTVNGRPLIEYHVESLALAGIRKLVVNHAYLGSKIEEFLGDGSQYGVEIRYSREASALETGGGIFKALPLLGGRPFIVVNADIWSNFDFSRLPLLEPGVLAHLVLVPNPEHHPQGDFSLQSGKASWRGEDKLTFSGIGVYTPGLFAGCHAGAFPLAPLLRMAMDQEAVTASVFDGQWIDVGTPERLQQTDQLVRSLARHEFAG